MTDINLSLSNDERDVLEHVLKRWFVGHRSWKLSQSKDLKKDWDLVQSVYLRIINN